MRSVASPLVRRPTFACEGLGRWRGGPGARCSGAWAARAGVCVDDLGRRTQLWLRFTSLAKSSARGRASAFGLIHRRTHGRVVRSLLARFDVLFDRRSTRPWPGSPASGRDFRRWWCCLAPPAIGQAQAVARAVPPLRGGFPARVPGSSACRWTTSTPPRQRQDTRSLAQALQPAIADEDWAAFAEALGLCAAVSQRRRPAAHNRR